MVLVAPCYPLFHAATVAEARRRTGQNGCSNKEKKEIKAEEE